jgi:hypothetical protein
MFEVKSLVIAVWGLGSKLFIKEFQAVLRGLVF